MSSPTSIAEQVGQLASAMLRRQLQSQSSQSDGVLNTTMFDDLDENATSSNDDDMSSSSRNDGGRDAYEFVAFLLWYLFLVLCCIIPTCCAYRRRRIVEARIAQQQASVNRIERQNVFILSNLRNGQQNTDRIRAQRQEKISEKLKDTTMTVDEDDIVDISDEEKKDLACKQCCVKIVDKTDEDSTEPDIAVEYDVEAPNPESTHALQLTSEASSISRRVPAACAICLCPYEKDDEVTWSTNEECQHAFHKDCIIPWLAKSDEPKCPCCRQDFCEAIPLSQLELDSNINDNNNNLFTSGFAGFGTGEGNQEIFISPHFLRSIDGSPFHVISPHGIQLQEQNSREQTNNTQEDLARGSPFEVHTTTRETTSPGDEIDDSARTEENTTGSEEQMPDDSEEENTGESNSNNAEHEAQRTSS